MVYIKVTKKGKGLYTHEDRKDMPTFKCLGDIFLVEGNYKNWMKRVGGKVMTETETKIVLKKNFDSGKAKEISRLTKELSKLQNKTFENDYKILKIR